MYRGSSLRIPAALEDEIDRRTDARKRRHDADLPNDKVIKQATPEPFEIQEPDASDAIAPRTAFGKWWLKVRDGVERAKERFNGWMDDYGEELVLATVSLAQLANIIMASDISEIGDGFTVAMVMGPITQSRKIRGKAEDFVKTWKHPGGKMLSDAKKPFKRLKKWEEEYTKLNDSLISEMIKSGVAKRYTSENYSKINDFERLDRNSSEFHDNFPTKEMVAEYEKVNATLSSQIKKSHLHKSITVARGLKSDLYGNLSQGDVIREPGFTSTSLSESQARNFARKGGCMVYIDLPAGSNALYLEFDTVKPEQYELLLDRGSKFRYIGYGEMPDGMKYYHMELENNNES